MPDGRRQFKPIGTSAGRGGRDGSRGRGGRFYPDGGDGGDGGDDGDGGGDDVDNNDYSEDDPHDGGNSPNSHSHNVRFSTSPSSASVYGFSILVNLLISRNFDKIFFWSSILRPLKNL